MVFDALEPEQVSQLRAIAGAVLERLDPEGWSPRRIAAAGRAGLRGVARPARTDPAPAHDRAIGRRVGCPA